MLEESETNPRAALTRRALLHRTAAGAASAAMAGGALGTAWGAAPARKRVVGLPSAKRIRADYQRMVDFGPRLPGYVEHDRFCDWLEDEFVAAGLELIPCDDYEYDRWRPKHFGLDVLDGAAPGPVKVATSFVRSKGTPPAASSARWSTRVRAPRSPAASCWSQSRRSLRRPPTTSGSGLGPGPTSRRTPTAA